MAEELLQQRDETEMSNADTLRKGNGRFTNFTLRGINESSRLRNTMIGAASSKSIGMSVKNGGNNRVNVSMSPSTRRDLSLNDSLPSLNSPALRRTR